MAKESKGRGIHYFREKTNYRLKKQISYEEEGKGLQEIRKSVECYSILSCDKDKNRG